MLIQNPSILMQMATVPDCLTSQTLDRRSETEIADGAVQHQLDRAETICVLDDNRQLRSLMTIASLEAVISQRTCAQG